MRLLRRFAPRNDKKSYIVLRITYTAKISRWSLVSGI